MKNMRASLVSGVPVTTGCSPRRVGLQTCRDVTDRALNADFLDSRERETALFNVGKVKRAGDARADGRSLSFHPFISNNSNCG